jgi:hypothetical protein
MINEKILTEKQKEMIWKKQRIVELANQGFTRRQIHEQLNNELKEKGLKEVSLPYVYKYSRMLNLS